MLADKQTNIFFFRFTFPCTFYHIQLISSFELECSQFSHKVKKKKKKEKKIPILRLTWINQRLRILQKFSGCPAKKISV